MSRPRTRCARGTGIGKPSGSRFFDICCRVGGRTVSESTKSPIKEVAGQLLQRRLVENKLGLRAAQDYSKYKYEDLRDALLADYEVRGHSSLVTHKDGRKTISALHQLDLFFAGRPAAAITSDLVREFVRVRQDRGAATSTINRNLAMLRRMLALAKGEGKVPHVPHFTMLQEADPREGFLDGDEFRRLRFVMPLTLWPLVTYLYVTGCRVGAAKKIDWSQIVLDGDRVEVRLFGSQVKNRTPLFLPLPADLAQLLRATRKPSGPVFCATNLDMEFRKAAVAVGLGHWRDPDDHNKGYDGIVIYDLRRSGVRNLLRAGVSEDIALRISGYKTRAVLSRYNIVDTTDLQRNYSSNGYKSLASTRQHTR
jgi:integrase